MYIYGGVWIRGLGGFPWFSGKNMVEIFCLGEGEGVLAPMAVDTPVFDVSPHAGADLLLALPEGVRVWCSGRHLVEVVIGLLSPSWRLLGLLVHLDCLEKR